MAILKSALAVLILASLLCGVPGCFSSKPETPEATAPTRTAPPPPPPPPDSYAAPETKTEPQSNWGEGTKWNLEHPSN